MKMHFVLYCHVLFTFINFTTIPSIHFLFQHMSHTISYHRVLIPIPQCSSIAFFHLPFRCSDINGMNNPVMNPKINFEKAACLGEFEADENVKDCVSSPDLLRMVE